MRSNPGSRLRDQVGRQATMIGMGVADQNLLQVGDGVAESPQCRL
jgi:hypothetical protein